MWKYKMSYDWTADRNYIRAIIYSGMIDELYSICTMVYLLWIEEHFAIRDEEILLKKSDGSVLLNIKHGSLNYDSTYIPAIYRVVTVREEFTNYIHKRITKTCNASNEENALYNVAFTTWINQWTNLHASRIADRSGRLTAQKRSSRSVLRDREETKVKALRINHAAGKNESLVRSCGLWWGWNRRGRRSCLVASRLMVCHLDPVDKRHYLNKLNYVFCSFNILT
jgi:hypothetical protein